MEQPDTTGSGDMPEGSNTSAEDGSRPDYTVAAVDRALDLLDILTRAGPMSLAQIAGEAGCTRTAAFRLLRTMAARGYVAQDGPRGNWRLGERMAGPQEAPGANGHAILLECANPVMERLARETGRVVYLVQRKGTEAVVIGCQQADRTQRRYSEVGDALPLHAGCGRLLLAFAPEPVQTLVLAARLARFSPATITSPRRLAAEIPIIRERGWFTSQDELIPGSVAFSAPIRDASGGASRMLTIACPTIVATSAERRALLRIVTAAAGEITRRLAPA